MATRALVPVAPHGKGRLAGVMRPEERVALVHRLAAHVVGVLRTAGLDVVVLSAGPLRLPWDVEVWSDEGTGLNASLASALERIGGPALVVPADLPWMTPADVDGLLAEPGDVVVARARDGGTNALLLRRPFAPAFGPRSALVHAARARAAGLRSRVVRVANLERDLDAVGDLQKALGSAPAFT